MTVADLRPATGCASGAGLAQRCTAPRLPASSPRSVTPPVPATYLSTNPYPARVRLAGNRRTFASSSSTTRSWRSGSRGAAGGRPSRAAAWTSPLA